MKLEPQTARSVGVRFAADEAQAQEANPGCGEASSLEDCDGTEKAARIAGWPISVSCEVLEVSVSGYFDRARRKSAQQPRKTGCGGRLSDEAVLTHIRVVVIGRHCEEVVSAKHSRPQSRRPSPWRWWRTRKQWAP